MLCPQCVHGGFIPYEGPSILVEVNLHDDDDDDMISWRKP